MPYAALQDMIDRFGEAELIQITDKKLLGAVDEAAFAQAQTDGDAEIDVYLKGSYVLPLASVPTVLVRVACDLYRYYLYGSLVPEFVEKRYKAAIDLLKSINKGDINLNLDRQGQPVEENTRDVLTAPGTTPVFTEQRLRNF